MLLMKTMKMPSKVFKFVLLICSTCFLTSSQNPPWQGLTPSRPVPPQYFGMHIHYAPERTSWPTTSIGTWRLWDTNVSWADLEPARNEWHFDRLDRLVQIAAEHNSELVLPLAYTPPWASSRPNEKSASGRLGVAAPPMTPGDWSDYVRKVVTRYRGRIQYYELWNEPNDPEFYSGDIKTLVRLGDDAYRIIKAIDPHAQVLSPAMMGSGPGVRRLDAYLRAGGISSFDIVSYHFYVTPNEPEAMLKTVAEVRSVMKENGISGVPIWTTEIGWAAPYKYDPMTSPAYVVRTYLISWMLGIDRVCWYAWDNQHWSTIQMVEADGVTETSAAIAFGNIERFMVGKILKGCRRTGANWSCVFVEPAIGRRTVVLWNEEGKVGFSSVATEDVARVTSLTTGASIPRTSKNVEFTGQPIAVELR
jgi:hypothetical protein